MNRLFPATVTKAHKTFCIAFAAGILVLAWGQITCYWGQHPFLSFGGTTASIIYPLFLFYGVLRLKNRDYMHVTFWKDPLFLFLLLAALSPFWGPLRDFTRVKGTIFPAILGYWMACYIISTGTREFRTAWLGLFVSSVSLVVLRGMTELLFMPERVCIMHSTQESHTIIAMLIITALPLAAALLSAGQRPAALHAVNTVILLAGLFLTSSRIGWIAFAFICLLFLWNQRGSRKILMGALLLPAVIFLMMCAALPHYGDRLSTLGSLSRDRETHTRLQNWKMCLAIAKDHLPLGISFSHIQYYRCARDKDSHFQYEHPHNMLLQIYVSLGIPGICLFAFLLWYSVDSFRKSKGRDLPGLHGAMGASLSGFFLVNMADTVFVSPRALLFICLLMAYLSWWHSLPCREASAEQTDEQ